MAWQCKDGKNTWKLFKEWALFMPLIIVSSPVNTLLWLLPRQPSCSKCTMSATVDGLCFYGDTNLPKSTFNSEPSCLVFHSKGTEGSNYKRLWIGQAWKQDRLSHDEKEDFFFFFYHVVILGLNSYTFFSGLLYTPYLLDMFLFFMPVPPFSQAICAFLYHLQMQRK